MTGGLHNLQHAISRKGEIQGDVQRLLSITYTTTGSCALRGSSLCVSSSGMKRDNYLYTVADVNKQSTRRCGCCCAVTKVYTREQHL
jgi:hypothetical protein